MIWSYVCVFIMGGKGKFRGLKGIFICKLQKWNMYKSWWFVKMHHQQDEEQAELKNSLLKVQY